MIDTHQHLFLRDHFTYSWADEIPDLRASCGPEEYRVAAEGCGISGTIFMESGVDPGFEDAEAIHACHMAEELDSLMLGVVACADASKPDFMGRLMPIAGPKLKGVRHRLHAVSDEVSLTATFRKNVAALGDAGLTFDLCVLPRQLGLAEKLAEACPQTTFILDHLGNPSAEGCATHGSKPFRDWSEGIERLALQPNVVCKISGNTDAIPKNKADEFFRLCFEHSVRCFGHDRLVWGSDWPVCENGVGLAAWCALTRQLLADLPQDYQNAILHDNAIRVYGLGPKTRETSRSKPSTKS